MSNLHVEMHICKGDLVCCRKSVLPLILPCQCGSCKKKKKGRITGLDNLDNAYVSTVSATARFSSIQEASLCSVSRTMSYIVSHLLPIIHVWWKRAVCVLPWILTIYMIAEERKLQLTYRQCIKKSCMQGSSNLYILCCQSSLKKNQF